MALLLSHASQLITLAGPDRARFGKEMSDIGVVADGALLICADRIVRVGATDDVVREMSDILPAGEEIHEVSCRGRIVAPGLVDSHTHLVFAANRLNDYESRLRGQSYEQIAAAGGGIQVSVAQLRSASAEELFAQALPRLLAARRTGTTTLEIKSGYGLDLESERRTLEVAARLGCETGMDIPRTFLGAHIVPAEYKERRAEYIDLVARNMLPSLLSSPAAPDFFDVFCDPAGFTVAESRGLLTAAKTFGIPVKLHAEQFARIGGLALGLEFNAVSVDHLDAANDVDGAALAGSSTVATLLPGSNMFLGRPWPPARALIDAGAAVSIATDFNPGTCPMLSMPLMMSLACCGMRMLPSEAWCSATINAAAALGRASVCGSLAPGKRADVAVFDTDDYRAVPYFTGFNLCAGIVQSGSWHPLQ